MAERMSLGKLTLHTACAYIDRILLNNYEPNIDNPE